LQGIKNQGLVDLRGEFNPQLNRLAVEQAGRAQQGLSGIGQNIVGDINRDRNALNQNSMSQFRQQAQGFAGAERLQAILQKQAEDELALGGQLSGQDVRNIDQLTQGATARQGRGSGAFNVGQLALGRQGAVDARKAQRRQFGMQAIQSGLATSNPLQRIMQQNAGTAGSLMERLGNVQNFARENTVGDFNPLGGSLLSNTQFNQGQQAGFNQRATARSDDMAGGAMSMLGNVDFGSLFGGNKDGVGGVSGGSFGGAGDFASGQHGPIGQGGSFFGQ